MSFSLVHLSQVHSNCYVPVTQWDETKVQFFAYLASNHRPQNVQISKQTAFNVINLKDVVGFCNNCLELSNANSFAIITVDRLSKTLIIEFQSNPQKIDITLPGTPIVFIPDVDSKNSVAILDFPNITATRFTVLKSNQVLNPVLQSFQKLMQELAQKIINKEKFNFKSVAAENNFSSVLPGQIPSLLRMGSMVTMSLDQYRQHLNADEVRVEGHPDLVSKRPPQENANPNAPSKEVCLVM